MRRVPETSPKPPIFITGATGFIGRRVLAELAARPSRPITCLLRKPHAISDMAPFSAVQGDLDRPESYAPALEGVHTVLHLGARTGKGSRHDHFAANCEGTEKLVRASRDAGVQRFVNVSTIATTFEQRRAYHYADAKQQAEEIVRSSGLRFVNVRPTFVFGAGSPVGTGLQKIATLPVVPLFGEGSIRTQPIHVEDVAAFLASAIDDDRLDRHDVDLGGPEVVSIRELLQRIRRAAGRGEARFVRIPGLMTMRMLALVEPIAGSLLPIGAGQLSGLVNDSSAKTTVPGAAPLRFRHTLDQMIRDTVAHA